MLSSNLAIAFPIPSKPSTYPLHPFPQLLLPYGSMFSPILPIWRPGSLSSSPRFQQMR